MPEKVIPLSELYHLCPEKPKGICPVRFCRKCSRSGGRLCGMHHVRAWRLRNPARAAFATLRDHAVGRKLEFTLTFEDFHLLCKQTGYAEGKGRAPSDLSIDRMDFRKGYVPGNIRVTTVSINSRKGVQERMINTSKGAVRWDEIDISEFIESEKSRKDKYDPRLKFDQPNPTNCISENDQQEDDRLAKAFGPANNDPF